jgi:hypothetical protein
MSNFSLRFGAESEIRNTLNSTARSMNDIAGRLQNQVNRLSWMSGFGIPRLRTDINVLANETRKGSAEITAVSTFIATVWETTQQYEDMALRELSGTLVENSGTLDEKFDAKLLAEKIALMVENASNGNSAASSAFMDFLKFQWNLGMTMTSNLLSGCPQSVSAYVTYLLGATQLTLGVIKTATGAGAPTGVPLALYGLNSMVSGQKDMMFIALEMDERVGQNNFLKNQLSNLGGYKAEMIGIERSVGEAIGSGAYIALGLAINPKKNVELVSRTTGAISSVSQIPNALNIHNAKWIASSVVHTARTALDIGEIFGIKSSGSMPCTGINTIKLFEKIFEAIR